MGVQTGEDEAAMEVEDVVGEGGEFAEEVRGGPEGADAIAVNDEGAVTKDTGGGVHGDDHGVVEEEDARFLGLLSAASVHFLRPWSSRQKPGIWRDVEKASYRAGVLPSACFLK